MERLDFIRQLFILYGKSTEKNIDLIRDYDLALSGEQNIDWEKMLRLVEKSELNSLPNPKFLKSLLPKCKIEIEGQYKYDSGKVIVKLKDRFYTYDIWQLNKTLEDCEKYYKGRFGSNFVSFVYYPPEFTIMGRNIYRRVNNKMELYEVI